MKIFYTLFCFLLIANSLFSQDFSKYKIPDSKAFYDLRMQVYADKNYHPYDTYTARNDFYPLMQDDPEEFVIKAEEWLNKVPIDIIMEYSIAFAYRHIGNYQKYTEHFHKYLGLISSITSTGDGKTCETAFNVINLSEEKAILNEFQLTKIEQALEGACDKITCKDREGDEVVIYFNVSKLFLKLRKIKKGHETPKTKIED